MSGDGCRADCTSEVCGDGIVDNGEQCDDGNVVSGDCCSSTCAFENGLSCDDGDLCTSGDVCQSGVCGGTTTPPTTPPTTGPTTNPPTTGTKMASSPYVYPGWGNPPAPSTVTGATGIKAFTVAFVLASNGCNPAWDGEGGLTGGVHASYIAQIKAAGADVVPSVGGYSGNKLGPNCTTTAALAGA